MVGKQNGSNQKSLQALIIVKLHFLLFICILWVTIEEKSNLKSESFLPVKGRNNNFHYITIQIVYSVLKDHDRNSVLSFQQQACNSDKVIKETVCYQKWDEILNAYQNLTKLDHQLAWYFSIAFYRN